MTAADGRGGHVDAEVKVASTWIDGACLEEESERIDVTVHFTLNTLQGRHTDTPQTEMSARPLIKCTKNVMRMRGRGEKSDLGPTYIKLLPQVGARRGQTGKVDFAIH